MSFATGCRHGSNRECNAPVRRAAAIGSRRATLLVPHRASGGIPIDSRGRHVADNERLCRRGVIDRTPRPHRGWSRPAPHPARAKTHVKCIRAGRGSPAPRAPWEGKPRGRKGRKGSNGMLGQALESFTLRRDTLGRPRLAKPEASFVVRTRPPPCDPCALAVPSFTAQAGLMRTLGPAFRSSRSRLSARAPRHRGSARRCTSPAAEVPPAPPARTRRGPASPRPFRLDDAAWLRVAYGPKRSVIVARPS